MPGGFLPTSDLTVLKQVEEGLGHAGSLSHLKEEVLCLHQVYRQRLVRYVASLGLGPSDAEDVVQETFLALFRHLRADKPRTNLVGWLFRVAHRTALKRRIANRSEVNTATDDSYLMRVADPSNPEEQILFDEDQRRLQRIFKVLPELDRLCLQLRAEGLKYREIANVLNISLGSVCNSLERSMNRLR
jgi:RNA polymerase sigma-70 factor (ECF subfamily)